MANKIRGLTELDYDAFVELFKGCGLSANGYIDNAQYIVRGIFEGDKLIGAFVLLPTDEEVVDLCEIAVAQSYRRKGYATVLLKEAISIVKKRAAQRILLEVRCSNIAAISLYERVGFKQISIRKKYYPDGEHAAVFQLNI